MTQAFQPTEPLRAVDRELLVAMRTGSMETVGDLTDHLGVTATAVRQRIERLLEQGLIEREKVVAGRGRPTFRYQLTVEGHRCAGANPVDLADALWNEVLAIEDSELRGKILSAVAARLGRRYAEAVADDAGGSFEERMQKLADMMASRQIASEVSRSGQLPVLDIGACPFPSLTDESDDRAMCRLEEQMISEALGQPVHLSSCRLDGDSCCQFSATPVDSEGAS